MIDVISQQNIMDGQIVTKETVDTYLSNSSAQVYEVIRTINKKPIFLMEHFSRMQKSMELCSLVYNISYEEFKSEFKLLIDSNDLSECNVRVSCCKNENEENILLMYYIKSSYPSEDMYEDGILTITAKKQRKNPNAKLYDSGLRDTIDQMLMNSKAFEAILINLDNTITEGSRSNVFFVKGDKLITSKDDGVLLGVTRQKVIEVCENSGIEVEKRNICVNELANFDAAFITGTSPSVLPIRTVDSMDYNSQTNVTVAKVKNLYLNAINEELSKN